MTDNEARDRLAAEPRTDSGMFLRDGLLALGFDEESANERIVAIENDAAIPTAADEERETERQLAYSHGYGDGLAATEEGLRAAPGRWAFLDTETGDWIEVKPGVVHVARQAKP